MDNKNARAFTLRQIRLFFDKELLQQSECKRPDERATQMPQAPQNDHDEHRAREVPAHHFRIDKTIL